jgi:hypothetical protein
MDLAKELMESPAIQAIAIKVIVDMGKGQLKNLDSNHVADHYGKYLQATVTLLTAITTFLTLTLQGHASQFDLQSFVQYFVTLFTSVFLVNHVVDASKQKLDADNSVITPKKK